MNEINLRDYFAAKFLNGYISTFVDPDIIMPPFEHIANVAYEMADAMVAARSIPTDNEK